MGPLPDPEAEGDGIKLGDPHKLDLVVYGSPISILYERTYPAYFGADFFAGVEKQAGSWHHIFARTDLFAYPFWSSLPADVTVSCPVCGYFVSAADPVIPTQSRTDYVVVDPVFWDWHTEEPPPPADIGPLHLRHRKAPALRGAPPNDRHQSPWRPVRRRRGITARPPAYLFQSKPLGEVIG
jgi:hypothetical protein